MKGFNEKIQEIEEIMKSADELMGKLNLPDFAKKIQVDSFKKKMNTLKEERESIQRTNGTGELIITMHPKELQLG